MSFLRAVRLCVRVEALFGARGVDVVQLLLLLGLDVLVLLHPAGVLQVTPVSSQRHQEMDLARETRGAARINKRTRAVTL